MNIKNDAPNKLDINKSMRWRGSLLHYYSILLLIPWGCFSLPFCPGIGLIIAIGFLDNHQPLWALASFFVPPLPLAYLIKRSDDRKIYE